MTHHDYYRYPYGAPDLPAEQGQESPMHMRPIYTADIAVVQRDHILLIKRRKWPYAGMWALPGGKQQSALEPLEQTALRELHEETGLLPSLSRLIYIDRFDTPGRDPRGPFV